MAPHVFAYRSGGVPSRIYTPGLPRFGHGPGDARYRLIEDDEVAAELQEWGRSHEPPLFRSLSAEDLEAALDSAADAVDAIEAGEYDAVLDLLLFAEREAFGSRVTVIDAIRERHRALKEQRQTESDGVEDVLMPRDVVTG